MKVTIKDVAKEADVSIATVSRVINNADNVSAEIREKVENAIKSLSYQPNFMARSLKNDITKIIGVIVSDTSNSFFSHIIRGIEKECEKHGYGMLVVSSDDKPDKEYRCITMLMEKRVDGMIVASTGYNQKYLKDISDSGIPVILIDRKPNMFAFDVVYVDKMIAMYDIIKMLLEMGHQKMAFITGAKELTTNHDRLVGMTQALYEYGMKSDQVQVYYGEYSIQYGMEVFRNLNELQDKPTALISGSEAITYGIMIEAQRQKVKIPEDISLVSFGINEEMKELIQPPITYIEDKKHEIGKIAGELVLKRIRNKNAAKETFTLQAKIIEAGSVAPIHLSKAQ